ncbi:MAG: M48 family metallopeptidase [Thermoanaerobaculaceae bacterium]
MTTLALALLALAAVPTALTLLARQQALATEDADPSLVWFRFARLQRLAVLLTWLGWLAAMWLGTLWVPAAQALAGIVRPGWVLGAVVALVPPALVHIVCQGLTVPVLQRVRGMDLSPGELVAQTWWHLAAVIPPVILLVAALEALQHSAWRATVLYMGGALAIHALATRRRMRAWQLETHAVTTGELRDRVFALAARAGVRVQQLYVLPARKARLANALAALGNVVVLTDYLLANLSRREVDAVVAHELAHLRKRHPLLLLVVMVALAWAFWGWGSWLPGWDVPLRAALAVALVLLLSRQLERSADRHAAALVGDPEALIAALAKLARLNLLPVSWGKLDEALLTHPSIRERARLLAQRHHIPWERVERLLEAHAEETDRYPMPAALAEDPPAFSSAFRRDLTALITWAMLAAMTIPPALVAWLTTLAGLPFLGSTALLAGGAVLTIAASQLVALLGPVWRQRTLDRRVRARLERRGELPAGELIPVGIAPGDQPRLYDNNYSFDVGFLRLDGSRLAFAGEMLRFSLRRTDVVEVGLGARLPSWWRPAAVVVRWRIDDGREGSVQLRVSGVRTLRALDRHSRELAARIERWRHEPDAERPSAPSEPPVIGEVTCQTPRGALRPTGCLVLAVLAAGLAAGLAVLARVHPFAGLAAAGTSVLALAFHFLPMLFHRDRPPVPVEIRG